MPDLLRGFYRSGMIFCFIMVGRAWGEDSKLFACIFGFLAVLGRILQASAEHREDMLPLVKESKKKERGNGE